MDYSSPPVAPASYFPPGELTREDQPQDIQPQAPSRYESVKQILDAAQGDETPKCQGLGRFWNLPLERFLTVTLYGIRMIAPPGTGGGECDDIIDPTPSRSCCQDEEPEPVVTSPPQPEPGGGHSCCGPKDPQGGGGGVGGGGGSKPSKGRGAASGLIKGLKGEFPFDGSQFPRLPWGGQPVSASDIIFIQSWIDDGCPATDATTYSPAQVTQQVTILAHTQRLERVTGGGWLAAGDAATTFDPLSSQGILKSLCSGVLASYAVTDHFKGSASGLEKYEALTAREFKDYLSARADFYGCERRWQDSPFWQRRSPAEMVPGLSSSQTSSTSAVSSRYVES